MINFDSLTLKAMMQEIVPVLEDGRVQKVQQPSRHELLLSIRSHGKNHKLYVNIDPRYPHIALLTKTGEELRDIEIPQKPPMFCMLLRKHIEGAKIRDIRQPEHERILEIYFDSYNDLGARIPLVLSCEIMGKYSNIILYGYDNNVIYGCAHNVGPEKSRERELSGGLPYVYPMKQNKTDLLTVSQEKFYEMSKVVPTTFNIWLNETFFDISLALATEVCTATGINIEKDQVVAVTKEQINNVYTKLVELLKLKKVSPSISKDKKFFSLAGINPNVDWEHYDSVNLMVDLYFGDAVFKDHFLRLKSSLIAVIKKELKKQKTKLQQHQKSLDAEEKAEKYKQQADILMANLNAVPVNAEEVILSNFYDDGKKIKIILDPALSASANAQKYYKLYNKARNAAVVSKDLMDKINAEIEYLNTVIAALDQSKTLSDLKQIQEELSAGGYIKSTAVKQKQEKMIIQEAKSSDGFKIYIGRNNRQNDYIISKIATHEDIWLHAQNIPGSHVLIRIPHEIKQVPDNTIFEAANLAAYFSQGQESVNTPVIYVKRKFLKKPPAAKPGYVTYSQEKTIFITPDKDLIQKLLFC